MSAKVRQIEIRGVEVHNLQRISLDIPRRQLIVVCGVSGSGKTSLALDTLYAEGQRRYIESFSAYTRQFLQRLEKPQAERISGLPPAIAVDRHNVSRSPRSTVGTATETNDYLRLLFARIGVIHCPTCGQVVRAFRVEEISAALAKIAAGTRMMIGFEVEHEGRADEPSVQDRWTALRQNGFARLVALDQTYDLAETPAHLPPLPWFVIMDRLTAGSDSGRQRDSLETSLRQGKGRCVVAVEEANGRREQGAKGRRGEGAKGKTEDDVVVDGGIAIARSGDSAQEIPSSSSPLGPFASSPLLNNAQPTLIDSFPWQILSFASALRCGGCGRDFRPLEPREFSFNSSLGACSACEGSGTTTDLDFDLIVTDLDRSIQQGGVSAWNDTQFVENRAAMWQEAERGGLPIDIPLRRFNPEQRRLLIEGDPAKNFAGVRGFLQKLETSGRKAAAARKFAESFTGMLPCPICQGTRLKPEPIAYHVGEKNLAELCSLRLDMTAEYLAALSLNDNERAIARTLLEQIQSRLTYLQRVGLGYLTLDRPLNTLSGGEAQRVGLASALGSNLVNMLYVFDEPSAGLHPRDVEQLIAAILGLRDRGNTVIVVEHEEAFLHRADQIIEIGPGAGKRGGKVVYQGPLANLTDCKESVTGDFLAGRRGVATPQRRPKRGFLKLTGCRGHNLQNITAEFPLGVLCVVAGVSGAGKSSLVQDTLFPALCRRKREPSEKPLPFDELLGDGQIDAVVMIDQEPIGRSPRSNPVTYLKAFDPIRQLFAETIEARTRNYTAGHFSFNVDGGRCTTCQGEGFTRIDMQFLADVFMKCPQCQGRRYRKEILAVTHRNKNIAEVLELSAQEAFLFFRGQPKIQGRLKPLLDVGLDYLPLGQPANTLSAGEAQRLKIASFLAEVTRSRTLFVLDEPTTGLHFADIVHLVDCFDALVQVGHSLIVVDHNLQLMAAADYLIDLGPGAGSEGGRIVAQGTPEEIASNPASQTGRYLAEVLQRMAGNEE